MNTIPLEDHLKHHFGFDSFRKGQKEVIQQIIDGNSAAAIFPTGSGKSLCYQLPALLLPGLTLVVSPLLALMKDQLEFLLSKGIPAAKLDSTLSSNEYIDVLTRAKSGGDLKILMISVERFKNERFRNQLMQMRVSLLVIDEAHCISEWGHNFRPEYLKLPFYKEKFLIPQVLALTATATREVILDMGKKLGIPPENITSTGFYRDNLFLQVSKIKERQKKDYLKEKLLLEGPKPTIIYVTLQKTAEEVAEYLREGGIHTSAYHAGMKNEERESIQQRFMRGDLDYIVATIAFGMGIDKKDIRRVIHYDLPKSIENYAQEIGRAGRDGLSSQCELLACKSNVSILENFVYADSLERSSIVRLLAGLKEQSLWEVKLQRLSKDLDIRTLPLKTLLVYLDMEGILSPKYTYFENYSFQYQVPGENILSRFQGERRNFIEAILQNCKTKKIWSYVDMEAILDQYPTDRTRVITALDYFNEMGWIDLQANTAVEVYEVSKNTFSLEETADKIYGLFKNKEEHEISRIHNMLNFFESDTCLSRELASYFGEDLHRDNCGHCSWCTKGPVTLEERQNSSFEELDYSRLTEEILSVLPDISSLNITKFLCGLFTPSFTGKKVKGLKSFGALEQLPFPEVKKWVEENKGAT